jgi:hypothetical protein
VKIFSRILISELLKIRKYSLLEQVLAYDIEDKKKMLETLKNFKIYFDETLKKYDIPNNWEPFQKIGEGFEYRGDLSKLNVPLDFKEPFNINNSPSVKVGNPSTHAKAGFGADWDRKKLRFEIHAFLFILIGDKNQQYTKDRGNAFLQWLLDTLPQDINYATFKKAFPSKTQVNLEYMEKLVDIWTQSDDYRGLNETAKEIEKAIKSAKKILPPEVITLQDPILYRAIFIDNFHLDSFLKGKPLKFKARKYSSWAASAKASQNYADEKFEWLEQPEDEVAVIFRHHFNNEDLVINVWELKKYAAEQVHSTPSEQAQNEQESIMKDAPTTYTLEDVVSYKKHEKPWKSISNS